MFHLKQKSFEIFFNRMRGEKIAPKPIIGYGAATIASSGKGEMSVPVKYIFDACKMKFHTELIDEYNTTKVCNRCFNFTESVKTNDKNKYIIRGLKRCLICKTYLNRKLGSD